MEKFLIRVEANYDFAVGMLDDMGAFWEYLIKKISAFFSAEKVMTRFSFLVLKMEANYAEDCETEIRRAWDDTGFAKNGITDVFVSKYDDTDTTVLMTQIYRNFYGIPEYMRLTTELTAMMPFLKEKGAVDTLRHVNYLFAVDKGCGFTTMVSSMGDYMHRMRFHEEGEDERKYYAEDVIGNETLNGTVTPDDLYDRLAGSVEDKKYNAIGIDVSYFLDKSRHDEFRRFLFRLSRFANDYVFIFRVPFLEKKSLDDFEAIIADIMTVRVVKVPPFHDAVLCETVFDVINNKGYTLDKDLFELILNRIKQEKADGRFYGFKTVKKVAEQIILKKALSLAKKQANGADIDNSKISAGDIEGFVDDSVFEKKGYAALNELVGMEKIAERIREIVAQVKVAMENDSLERPCIHMRFTGAPGTGKTTVARIIGTIFKEEGILRKGNFLEYTGRDLVAEYVGQTAVKTASICRDSYGSVLFIDEAYALFTDEKNSNDFGKEAITTLISEMENHRDDMLVVMAGYIDEMDILMKANPGLRSRMPYIIDFPSYNREQLYKIFMQMVGKHFKFTEDLDQEAKKYFDGITDEVLTSKEFANARFVRNLYERTWSKGALRASMNGAKDFELKREDFIAASSEKEFSEKLAVQKKIGF